LETGDESIKDKEYAPQQCIPPWAFAATIGNVVVVVASQSNPYKPTAKDFRDTRSQKQCHGLSDSLWRPRKRFLSFRMLLL
jgi:hypothetical protein